MMSGAVWSATSSHSAAGATARAAEQHDRLLLSRAAPHAVPGRVFALRYSLRSWGTAIGFAAGGGLVALVGPRSASASETARGGRYEGRAGRRRDKPESRTSVRMRQCA